MIVLPVRRIALFSDIHGNLPALDAVLADIESAGIDERYCLGDLVGYGPDPSGVVERIRASGIPAIKGNYDEGVSEYRGECGCFYATAQAKLDGAASYAFTDAALSDADRAWLAALPGEIRIEHEGTRILLVHGSPRRINEYLLPDRQDAQLIRLAEQAGADVVCVGHVHIPYHRSMAASDGRVVHYVSTGSVGKPKDGDPRACWVEVSLAGREVPVGAVEDISAATVGASEVRMDVQVHRVDYDVEAVVAGMEEAGLPRTLMDALRTA